MQKFKTLLTSRQYGIIGVTVLAVGVAWPLVGAAQDKSDKAQDPAAHSQHKDKQPAGRQSLSSQLSELEDKVARLEATLVNKSNGMPSDMPKQSDQVGVQDKQVGVAPGPRASAKYQNCIQCHQTRPSGPLPANAQNGMAQNGMMEKMDKMMGMMEKMMSGGAMQAGQGAPGAGGMGGGASPATAESKVMEKMDRLMGLMEKMIGGGAMQPAPAAPAMAPMPMM